MDNFISLRKLRNWVVTASIVTILSSLIFVTPVVMAGTYFPDVADTEWYGPQVNGLAEQGVIDRTQPLYRPGDQLNRAEAAKLVVLAGIEEGVIPELETCGTTKPFPDVEVDAWYCDYAKTALSNEIFTGYPDGTFGGGNYIQRDEMAAVIQRTFFIENFVCEEGEQTFTDVTEADWSYESIQTLYHKCVVTGYGDGSYGKGNKILRSESAVLIYRGMNEDLTCEGATCPAQEFEIESASAASETEVEVTFSTDVDEDLAAELDNYTITFEVEAEEVAATVCAVDADCTVEGETCNTETLVCEVAEAAATVCATNADCTVAGETCNLVTLVCEVAPAQEADTTETLEVTAVAVDGAVVTLTTDEQTPGTEYTLTVEDITSAEGVELTDSDVTFTGFDDSVGGGLEVALSESSPAGATIPKGASGVVYACVDFTASADDVTLNGLKWHRYGPGNRNDFNQVYVYDGETRLGSGKSISSDTNEAEFNNLGVAVDSGETKTLCLKADLNTTTATAGNVNGFELQAVSSVTSNASETTGTFPIQAEEMTLSGATVGSLTITKTGSLENPFVGSEQAEISKFRIDSATEGSYLESVTVFFAGTIAASDITDLNLYVQGEDEPIATAAEVVGEKATLIFAEDADGLTYLLKEGTNKTFTLKADLAGKPADTIRTYLEETTDLSGLGQTYGYGMRVTRVNYGGSTTDTNADGTAAEYHEVTLQGGTITLVGNGPVAGTVGVNTDNSVFLNIGVTSTRNVEFRQLSVTVYGTGTEGIYDATPTLNIDDVRIIDADTNQTLMGPSDPSTTGGDTQTITFTDTWTMDEGETRNIAITMDIASGCPANEVYRVELDAISTSLGIKDTDTNKYITDIVPAADVQGNNQTTATASTSIALSSSVVTSTVPRGSTANALAVVVQNGATEATKITGLTAYVWVDIDADTFYNDADDGQPKNRVLTVELQRDGAVVGTAKAPATATLGAAGATGAGSALTWTNLALEFDPSETDTLTFVANLSNTAITGTSDIVGISLDDGDVTAEVSGGSNAGNSVTFTGGTINTTAGTVQLTVSDGGTLVGQVAGSGVSPSEETIVEANTNDNVFSAVKLTATQENITVKELVVYNGYRPGSVVATGDIDIAAASVTEANNDGGTLGATECATTTGGTDDTEFEVQDERAYWHVDDTDDEVNATDIRMSPFWNGTVYYKSHSVVAAGELDVGSALKEMDECATTTGTWTAAGTTERAYYDGAGGTTANVEAGDTRIYAVYPGYDDAFKADGVTITDGTTSYNRNFVAGEAEFTGLNFDVPKGTTKTFQVLGDVTGLDMTGTDSGSDSGDRPRLDIALGDAVTIALAADSTSEGGYGKFKAQGAQSNAQIYGLSGGTLNGSIYPMTIRGTKPVIEKQSLTSVSNGESDIFKFKVTPGSGTASLKRFQVYLVGNTAVDDNLTLATFKLYRGTQNITDFVQIFNTAVAGAGEWETGGAGTPTPVGSDLTTVTLTHGEADNTADLNIAVLFDTEEAISAVTEYTLKATVGLWNATGDSFSVRFSTDSNLTDAITDVMHDDRDVTNADDTCIGGGACDLELENPSDADTIYHLVWSDNSRSTHNYSTMGLGLASSPLPSTSADWTNGRLLKDITSTQSFSY